MAKKTGLGKGLDALFDDNSTISSTGGAEEIKISEIQPNRNQPRQAFDQESLLQLADSIREHGVIQPVIVRPLPTGGYQLVAGERRYRASRMAGLNVIPAVLRDLSDTQVMEIALIENLQREDLNPIEIALGYQELMDHYQFTQDQVAKSVGKSRPAVANTLRLLQLPEALHPLIISGELTAGHARTLLALEDPAQIMAVADRVVQESLTVRALETLVKKMLAEPTNPEFAPSFAQTFPATAQQRYYQELQLALTSSLGRAVEIKSAGKKSKLVIEFYDEEDLKQLLKQTMGTIVTPGTDEVDPLSLQDSPITEEYDTDVRY